MYNRSRTLWRNPPTHWVDSFLTALRRPLHWSDSLCLQSSDSIWSVHLLVLIGYIIEYPSFFLGALTCFPILGLFHSDSSFSAVLHSLLRDLTGNPVWIAMRPGHPGVKFPSIRLSSIRKGFLARCHAQQVLAKTYFLRAEAQSLLAMNQHPSPSSDGDSMGFPSTCQSPHRPIAALMEHV